jgi:predicted nucleic acid-binding protein
MLLCSVSIRHDWEIFTTDRDFAQYGRVVNIRLMNPVS